MRAAQIENARVGLRSDRQTRLVAPQKGAQQGLGARDEKVDIAVRHRIGEHPGEFGTPIARSPGAAVE
jgi:hypothetical protein